MSKLTIEKVPSSEDRTLPVLSEFDELLDRVRDRAYDLFCARGRSHGHALDDWLAAEREVLWPEAELAEQNGEFELSVELPGFDPDEVNITATPRELIIKAAHLQKLEKKNPEQEGVIHWSEIHRKDVFRRIELPAEVDVTKVSAALEHGVLTIDAPKAGARAKKRKTAEEVAVS